MQPQWPGYGPPPTGAPVAQQGYGPPAPQGYGPPAQGWPPPYAMPGLVPEAQPTERDVEQLKNLAIGHFVYAGLVGFGALFALVYVLIGLLAASAPATPGEPDPIVIGGIFAAIGLFVSALFATKAVLLVVSGLGLRSQTRMVTSMIAAGLSLMTFPLGTVLGVLTFVVLMRPQIKALYKQREAQR